MKGYDPKMSFGEDTAGSYDDALRGDEGAAVAFLAGLAQGGPALELAVGTGRIALPLSAAGIRVDGIDFSEPMVDRLRSKPGGEDMAVTIGDFVNVGVDGTYKLIYVVFNSFFNVLSQNDQVRCFENVARHLDAGGHFLIEGGLTLTFINDLMSGQYVRAESIAVDAVGIDLLELDPATQMLYENHLSITKDGVRFGPIVQRYAWPGELDLMARIAGLELTERWGSWTREPFTATSTNIVSVWRRP